MQIAEAQATRGPIKLSPGVIISGEPVLEAEVRLLTRADHTAARKHPEDERDDFLFTRSIVSLGLYRDPAIVAEALSFLRTPDEARLRMAVALLEQEHMTAPELAGKEPTQIVPESDICSEVFELSPGFTVNGKHYGTCAVRLLTRGQWKQVNQEPDLVKREDLVLLFAIAEIGGEKPTPQLIDCITDVDNERINSAGERLRAQHAPESKSWMADDSGDEPAGNSERTPGA